MKHKRLILRLTFGLALLGVAYTTSAILLAPFVSWDDLTGRSPEIVIAKCLRTPEPRVVVNEMVYSDIEVLSVLKGKTTNGTSQLFSGYWPRQGERFLVISGAYGGAYSAPERYRIVPIGEFFIIDQL